MATSFFNSSEIELHAQIDYSNVMLIQTYPYSFTQTDRIVCRGHVPGGLLQRASCMGIIWRVSESTFKRNGSLSTNWEFSGMLATLCREAQYPCNHIPWEFSWAGSKGYVQHLKQWAFLHIIRPHKAGLLLPVLNSTTIYGQSSSITWTRWYDGLYLPDHRTRYSSLPSITRLFNRPSTENFPSVRDCVDVRT